MNLKRALIAAAAIAALPASAFAQSVFDVNVTFTPDTGATTTAYISCNGGVPLEQEKDGLGDGDGVDFVVEETNETTDCTVTGADVDGYSVSYVGSGTGLSCSFDNIGAEASESCRITYNADDVSFTVTKTWDVSGTGGDLLDPDYRIRVICTDEITDTTPDANNVFEQNNGNYRAVWRLTDTAGGSFSVDVDASDGDVECRADETIAESAVETVSNCGDFREVPFGGSASCSITNTVFYEGIPTLSQYGLAIMALLMLGVGFIGFRRFV